MNNLMWQIKNDNPNVQTVKVFSDGCAGQFKNRWVMAMLMSKRNFAGINVEWNFLAPGHGKGAVDGIGGTAKRAVATRIKSRAVVVQNAEDFHKCMRQHVTGIESYLIPKDDIQDFKDANEPHWNKVKNLVGISKHFHFAKVGRKLAAKQTTSALKVKKYSIY